MAEYIEREVVLRAYEEEQRRRGQWRFEKLIASIPAADVVPKEKIIALVSLVEEICKDQRERHVDDSVCGLCEFDGAYIGESGDWMKECPGFERNDCFCLSKIIKEKYLG